MEKPKKDTALKVFAAALDRSSTSRTAIANDTGLSYVTVDKAVNFLIEQNILKQSYSSKSAVIERRSRMLSAKSHYWIAVYEILPTKFTFYMTDLSLRIFRSFSHTPEDSIFIDDLLTDFLKSTVSFAKKHAKDTNCIGSAVLTIGNYDNTTDKITGSPIYHLPSIKIRDFFSRYSFDTIPFVYSLHSTFGKAIQGTLSDDEAVYSLFLDKSGILSSYLLPEGPVHINDIGCIKSSSNVSLSSIAKRLPDPDLLFNDLCDALCVLLKSLKITRITVCDSLYNNANAVCSVISNTLNKNRGDSMPNINIVPADISENTVKYISREIRYRWFCEKILTDKA